MEDFNRAIEETKEAQAEIRYKVGKAVIAEFLKKVKDADLDIPSHRTAFDVHFTNVMIFMDISDEDLENEYKIIAQRLNQKLYGAWSVELSIIPEWENMPIPSHYELY